MSSWSSYPSIYSFGHAAIRDLLTVEVNLEEKADGSQFSFGLVEASHVDPLYVDDHTLGPLAIKVRSKGAVMHIDAPQALFEEACQTVKRLAPQLHPGWTYRSECLKKPKHNVLAYDRVPNGNLIIFDINTGNQEYLSYEAKATEAGRLGLEVVPRLYSGRVESVEQFRNFLETTSVLGGQKIEGVVAKPVNYNLFGSDKKVLMGKFVSEAYKEVHRKTWGESNPGGKDILSKLGAALCLPTRWNKAIMHLRERGLIEDSVRDIGPIMREIPADVLKEEEEWIKDQLFKWAWPHISRQIVYGFPQWYKDQLLLKQFEPKNPMSEDKP